MRELDVADVTTAVADLSMDACYNLGDDVVAFFRAALEREESEAGRDVFRQLLENAEIARREAMPLCQDTGLTVIFLEVGQDVHLVGGSIEEAVNAGVARGYADGYLRKSAVEAPFAERTNTGNNTPAILHTRLSLIHISEPTR